MVPVRGVATVGRQRRNRLWPTSETGRRHRIDADAEILLPPTQATYLRTTSSGMNAPVTRKPQKYGKMLSHDVSAPTRLAMIRESNYISVVNTNGRELFKISLSSLSA